MKEGWEIKKLGEVCEIKGRIGYRGYTVNDLVEKGNGAITLSPSNIQNNQFNTEKCTYISWFKYDESPEIMVFNGDILFVKTGSTYGKVALVENLPEKATINPQFVVLKDVKCLNKFLYYALTTIEFKEKVENIIGGAATPTLSQTNLAEQTILIPKSILEQQRIVSILDEAFAAIDKAKANAEQNLKNASELFESYLQGVFEKKGEGWGEKTLEELADERCTLSYGIVQPGEEFENGLPIIRPVDLISRYVKVEGLKRIDPKLSEGYKRTKLIGDELLLCVRGTTGIVSIATAELKDANVTRGIVPIRFNSKIINQDFGYYLLISNYVQKQIKAKTYGAALMQINIGDLRKINAPYPKTQKDQFSIVQKLDALFAETKHLEAIYQKKLQNLEELRKSILQKAFSGEL